MGNIFDWLYNKFGSGRKEKAPVPPVCPDNSKEYQDLYDRLMSTEYSLRGSRTSIRQYIERTYPDAGPFPMDAIEEPPEKTDTLEAVDYAARRVNGSTQFIKYFADELKDR